MIDAYPPDPRIPPAPAADNPAATPAVDGVVVAGLARELERACRDLDRLRALAGRVEDLARMVTRLSETFPSTGTQPAADGAPSWLDLRPDPGRDPAASPAARDAKELLTTLAGWVGAVYLRYHDAAIAFPDCWLWHPDVVEELLWLHTAWLAAYADGAAPSAVGDWHDRQRPGVLARIRTYVGHCSLEAHQAGQERHTPAPTAPTSDAIDAIAGWWATGRDQPGPVPTNHQLATADARRRSNARSRR